ncbi:MAG TPA: 2-C-methyl-D-erythritol 4-phosphate cytidylyltransferase [Candidatus Omnitrophota bacterium]|nr:2-C-methyl-D-erythritol 4-phosphate cytidylyltransferase [Candidatus Omnitrophota bacterium]
MKIQAIIPAAGSGSRLKTSVPKPFIVLNGLPLIVHTLKRFEECALIQGVILVVPSEQMGDFEALIKKYAISKVNRLVVGGKTRCESVSKGLAVIDHDTAVVVVHDGARPVVDAALIERAIHACQEYGAVVVGVPIKPTIKRVDPQSMSVAQTIDRKDLWEIQTPQVFKRDILVKAHEQNQGKDVTDCAMLVEQMGVSVKIIEGDYRNIKVTTEEDLTIAQAFIAQGNGQLKP